MTIDETITVTDDDVRGAVRSIGRPRGFAVLLVVGALAIVLTIVSAARGDTAIALLFGVLATLMACCCVLLWVIVGRSIRRGMPAGSRLRLRADADGILTDGELGSSEIRYAGVRRIDRRGTTITLRLVTGGVGVLPGRLLDDAQLAMLRSFLPTR